MPSYQFSRHIHLTIGGLAVTENRVSLVVDRPADGTQDSGVCEVWSLPERVGSVIDARNVPIRILAGYDNRLGLIFDGIVQQVQRGAYARSGNPNRVIRLRLGSVLWAGDRAGGVTVRAYSGAHSAARIVADLASDVGLPVDPLTLPPIAGRTLVDWSWTGQTTRALTVLLDGLGFAWLEDDGIIRVRPRGAEARRGAPHIVTGPSWGLLGDPVYSDEGATIRTLLNGTVQRGSVVDVYDDRRLSRWVAVSYTHRADNREGVFETQIELRPHRRRGA